MGAFDEDGGAIEVADGPGVEVKPGKPVTTGASIFNTISDNHVLGKCSPSCPDVGQSGLLVICHQPACTICCQLHFVAIVLDRPRRV